jgi:hypothetical protein
LGAKTLKKSGGTNLASADLASGVVVQMVYDGTNMQITSETAAGASGVTSVGTSGQVCGGTITTTGTISLCTQGNNTVMANISGSTAAPGATAVPVATSWGIGTTSAASGTFTGIHSASTHTLGLAANGVDAATIFTDQGITVGSPSGGDEGSGSLNASALYVNGVAVATGSGANGLVLLNSQTVSGVSSVVFSSTYITSTYNKYVLHYSGMTSGSSGCFGNLALQYSTNNGSSYVTTGYSSVGGIGTATGAGDGVYLAGSSTPIYNTSTPSQGDIIFSVPSSSSQKVFEYEFQGFTTPSGSPSVQQGLTTNTGTTAFNNVKIIDISGACNNISGTFTLSGFAQ